MAEENKGNKLNEVKQQEEKNAYSPKKRTQAEALVEFIENEIQNYQKEHLKSALVNRNQFLRSDEDEDYGEKTSAGKAYQENLKEYINSTITKLPNIISQMEAQLEKAKLLVEDEKELATQTLDQVSDKEEKDKTIQETYKNIKTEIAKIKKTLPKKPLTPEEIRQQNASNGAGESVGNKANNLESMLFGEGARLNKKRAEELWQSSVTNYEGGLSKTSNTNANEETKKTTNPNTPVRNVLPNNLQSQIMQRNKKEENKQSDVEVPEVEGTNGKPQPQQLQPAPSNPTPKRKRLPANLQNEILNGKPKKEENKKQEAPKQVNLSETIIEERLNTATPYVDTAQTTAKEETKTPADLQSPGTKGLPDDLKRQILQGKPKKEKEQQEDQNQTAQPQPALSNPISAFFGAIGNFFKGLGSAVARLFHSIMETSHLTKPDKQATYATQKQQGTDNTQENVNAAKQNKGTFQDAENERRNSTSQKGNGLGA
ncbi:MAG: hypothetical protein SFT91_03550 [Rickettsiaceae bacterium]|nr:hypothetical protein [Rickettsiaceae bacterium]